MARTVGTVNHMEASSVPSLTLPLTMAIWGKPSTFVGSTFLGIGGSPSTPGQYIALGHTSGGNFFVEEGTGGTDSTGGLANLNAWNHYAAVFTSSTNRVVYGNGVAGSTAAAAYTPSGMNRINVSGVYITGSLSSFSTGDAAYATIWSGIALSAGEIRWLSAGLHPLDMHPEFISGFWPISGNASPEPDLTSGGRNLALTGTPPPISDPPVKVQGLNLKGSYKPRGAGPRAVGPTFFARFYPVLPVVVSGPASFNLTASDSITFSESLARVLSVGKTISFDDSMFFNESLTRVAGHPRTISFDDAIIFNEALTRGALAFARSPTDSITLSESLARSTARARAISDGITFAESVASAAGKIRPITDSITFAEALARAALSFARTPTESITFAEALTRTTARTRALTDNVTFAESVARTVAETRAISDSITFSEALTRGPLGFTRAPTDSITFAESLARIASHPRSIADSITFAEALTRGALSYTRPATESITFAESVARAVAETRAISDAITLTEALTFLNGKTRTSTDSITLTEALSRGPFNASRALADAITFSESLARIASEARSVMDSITLTDVVTRGSLSRIRAIADSITFAESLARQVNLMRAPIDSITFSESLTRALAEVRTLSDAINFAESVTRTRGSLRSITDSITFAESLARSTNLVRSPSDGITLSESLTRTALAFIRAATDSINFSEALSTSGAGSSIRAATDSITFSESLARVASDVRTLADSITFAEVIARAAAHPRTLTDSLTLTDVLTRGGIGGARSSADAITLSDVLTRSAANNTRTSVDAINFAEALVRVASFSRTAASSYFTTILGTSGLQGYWRVGEGAGTNAVDSTGANDGTYSGGFTLGTLGPLVGDSNTAVTLDGTTGGIQIPATFPTLAGSAVTFEGWIKPANTGTSARTLYGGYHRVAGNPGWGTGYSISSSRKIGYWSSVTNAWVESTGQILDTNWHYIVVTCSAAGLVSFYIDGLPAGTANSNPPGSNALTRWIGKTDLPDGWWPGGLDEIAIYNRVLTPGEVAQHYARALIPGDGLLFIDVPSRASSRSRSLVDSATLSDAVIRTLSASRSVTDTVAFAEALTRSTSKVVTATDALTLSDLLIFSAGKTRSAVDTLTLTDSLVRSAQALQRALGDHITFAEALSAVIVSTLVNGGMGRTADGDHTSFVRQRLDWATTRGTRQSEGFGTSSNARTSRTRSGTRTDGQSRGGRTQ